MNSRRSTSSASLGPIVGSAIAKYRKAAGLTQPELAMRVADLGVEIGRGAIANIEAGGREDSSETKNASRAAGVTVTELLAFALALDVPPVLLLVPLGDVDAMTVGNVTMHPDYARRWIAGEEPPARWREGEAGGRSFGVARWSTNSRVVDRFRELHEAYEPLERSAELLRSLEAHGGSVDEITRAREIRDEHLRAFDAIHRRMVDEGLSIPEVPDEWADRIMWLRAGS